MPRVGAGAADLIESPAVDDEGLPVNSKTVQEFYYHLDDAAKEGRPFIYVLDSMDSLEAKEDQEKFEKQKKAHSLFGRPEPPPLQRSAQPQRPMPRDPG